MLLWLSRPTKQVFTSREARRAEGKSGICLGCESRACLAGQERPVAAPQGRDRDQSSCQSEIQQDQRLAAVPASIVTRPPVPTARDQRSSIHQVDDHQSRVLLSDVPLMHSLVLLGLVILRFQLSYYCT